MAFKITKAEQNDIERKLEALTSSRRELDDAIEKFNLMVREQWEQVAGSVATYNEAKFNLGGTFRDLYDQTDGEFADKSENWQDGERGQITREWIDKIEGYAEELETELTVTEPDEIDINEETDFETYLEDLETEPAY